MARVSEQLQFRVHSADFSILVERETESHVFWGTLFNFFLLHSISSMNIDKEVDFGIVLSSNG